MKITRRNAITSLGILASGAAIPHSASGDAAQTCIKPSGNIPRECTPDADSWVLKYNQPDPKDAPGARGFVYENFIFGLQWGFAPFFPGPPKPKPDLPQPAPNCVAPKIHDRTNAVALARAQSEFKATFDKSLDKSYGKVFDDLVPSFVPGTIPIWAKDWVTLNDHAFILGCLVLALAKDRTLKNLTHRDYLRAQAKLMHAISSVQLQCACFIACQDAFGMPSAPDRKLAENKWLPDPLRGVKPPAGGQTGAPGQIDEDCILCT